MERHQAPRIWPAVGVDQASYGEVVKVMNLVFGLFVLTMGGAALLGLGLELHMDQSH